MSKIYPVSLWILIGLGSLVSAAFVLISSLTSPSGTAVGLASAVVLSAVLILLFRLLPTWPRAGFGWSAASFLWGGSVAVSLALASGPGLSGLVQKIGWYPLDASLSGAYPEELGKALGVLLILFSFRKLNRPWHGLMTGAMIGLGFEAVENIQYGAIGAILNPNGDAIGSLEMWGNRTLFGIGLHVVFTSLSGWGIGRALFLRDRTTGKRWLTGAVWVLVAFLLHFGWNIQWGDNQVQLIALIVTAVVVYGAFLWVLIVASRQARRDRLDPSTVSVILQRGSRIPPIVAVLPSENEVRPFIEQAIGRYPHTTFTSETLRLGSNLLGDGDDPQAPGVHEANGIAEEDALRVPAGPIGEVWLVTSRQYPGHYVLGAFVDEEIARMVAERIRRSSGDTSVECAPHAVTRT
ncbi:PrsW family intramembrane metalloprotease [Rothia uropygialis]|uniref:PrsW family intramembrane metalloprotease n=1 Tax=Kocuria sp. 36 TaxID=1415402 RepID=UPI00101D71C8|nr:PrsW family intramembrane metalloprotease [Kocuria sp. 36]